MKKRVQLIFCFGNLVIALLGLVAAIHSFNRIGGVVLYFGKHDKFPAGIEDWVYPALLEGRNNLAWVIGIFLALILFNCVFGLWIWLSNLTIFASRPSHDNNL